MEKMLGSDGNREADQNTLERIRINKERAQRLARERAEAIALQQQKLEADELEGLLEFEQTLKTEANRSSLDGVTDVEAHIQPGGFAVPMNGFIPQPQPIMHSTSDVKCNQTLPSGDVCGNPVTKHDRDMLFEAFGEAVCPVCKQSDSFSRDFNSTDSSTSSSGSGASTGRAWTDFDLLSKDQIRVEYCLAADTIKHMKYATRPNPHNVNWIPMRLYLRKHAVQRAIARYGDAEHLQAERGKRSKRKFERDLEATESFFENATKAFKTDDDDNAKGAEQNDDEENDNDYENDHDSSLLRSFGCYSDDEDGQNDDEEIEGNNKRGGDTHSALKAALLKATQRHEAAVSAAALKRDVVCIDDEEESVYQGGGFRHDVKSNSDAHNSRDVSQRGSYHTSPSRGATMGRAREGQEANNITSKNQLKSSKSKAQRSLFTAVAKSIKGNN